MQFQSSYVSRRTILIWLSVAWSTTTTTTALIKLPENVTVPAVIAFGDSIVDAGNNNNIQTLIKCNFPPYGLDFYGGIPTGRFCDGKIPSDIIAEELGVKEILPAYLDPTLLPQDLITGVTFASGGSGFDPLTSKLASVISLTEQLNHFKGYIAKVKGIVGEEEAKFIIRNSLYLVVAGSDDIANTYFSLRARKLHYDVPAYTDLMANSASTFIQDLYNLGGRRIGVFSAPPIGCVPSQRTLAGGSERVCADNYNEAATLFNSKLSAKLNSLTTSLPQSKIIYIDIYKPLLNIIQYPKQYGFEVVNKGCCGTGAIEVAVLCNGAVPVTCDNVSNHVFWDSYHPTEKAYKLIVSQNLQIYSFFRHSSFILNLLLLVLTNILLRTTNALIKLPPNVTVPAIFVFGDSIVDTGNNNYIPTIIKCNFPPYGVDFKGGFATGRFCDGKVPSDLIAEELGIKDTVPAYLDPNILPQDFLTGVTFASGGSGYDLLTANLVSVISLDKQLAYFGEYIERAKRMVGEERTKNIIGNSLFMVVAGSNDIANTYFTLKTRKAGYNINAYTDLLANSAYNFVKNLSSIGATRIGVLSSPPVGCVPAQRTLAGGFHRECDENQNQAAFSFNYKLNKTLAFLNTQFPNSKIVFIDVYTSLLDIISNPQQYGFDVSNKGCCGTGNIEAVILCTSATPTMCPNVSDYVFWDSYHPTEKTYRILVSQFVKNYSYKFF
ncbi:GDSL esterase/lipase EXL1-like [Mercurialis annua]|uniref:GDSL esterase/lipase EXL1-like n=1 Tax=Mercurialis annua TaxID=3986 RepID=UPI00215FB9CC|nr:GDSL esterase/lipase EXL1-like [Mercurialis annua]